MLVRIALACVLALGIWSCKKDTPTPQPPAQAQGLAASKPAASDAAVLARIPADALAVVLGASPKDLAEKLGRTKVTDALGLTYAKAAAAITLFSGHDLLDPAAWAGFGVDPDAPFGFAWLHARDEAIAVFFTLKEPQKLITFVKGLMARAGGGEPIEQKEGDVTLVYAERDPEAVLVVAPDSAFLVISDRGGEEGMRHARRVATQRRDGSLLASDRFKGALSGLAFGRDATVWVDTQALVAAVEADLADRGEKPVEMPSDDAWAKEHKARMDAENERWSKRQQAELELLRQLVGGFDGLALGLEVEGPALNLKAWGRLKEGTLLARGLKGAKGAPAVLRSLADRPMFAAAGTVDPAVAMEVVRLFARADGEDLDQVFGELKGVGVDVPGAVWPLLDGRVGFAFTADLAAIYADPKENVSRKFGMTFTVGVKDPAKAKEALNSVWKVSEISELVTVEGDRARVKVPDWHDVHVGVVGDTVLITSDPGAFERLAAGAARLLTSLEGTPVGQALSTPEPSAMMLYDHRLAGLLFLLFQGSWPEPDVTLPDDASPEQKKLLAQYQAAKKTLADLEKRREDAQLRLGDRIFSTVGVLAASGNVQGGAFVARGAQVMPAPIPDAAATIAKSVVELIEQDEASRRERWTAQDRADELRRALADLPEPGLAIPAPPIPADLAPPEPPAMPLPPDAPPAEVPIDAPAPPDPPAQLDRPMPPNPPQPPGAP